jgi:hypothetical protein
MIGDLKAWSTHMSGLKEIVRLRGGFDEVYKSEFLGMILTRYALSRINSLPKKLKIYSVDSSGSCDLDITPYLAFPKTSIRVPPHNPSPRVQELFDHLSTTTTQPSNRDTDLISTFNDLILATSDLRFEASRTRGQIYSDKRYLFRNIFPLFHRLLSLPKAKDATLYEALRLAGILYCVTIRLAFTLFTTRGATQLKKLKVMIEQGWDDNQIVNALRDEGLWWVEAWILAMGVIVSEQNGMGRECFETRLKKIFASGRRRVNEFERRMNEFLWFDDNRVFILKMG